MSKVPEVVDSINMPYHHGNLRETLVDVGLELARQDGPDAVVLRAVSRAAGVSHNAAYRHFADRDDLLFAVCGRCMARLAALMRERIGELRPVPDRQQAAWDVLRAAGQAYVEFALDEPGWFRTAFGVPRDMAMHHSAPEGAADDPYRILISALDGLVDSGAMDPARRPGAEYAAWAAVHGISTLLIDGPLRDLPAGERRVAVEAVLGAIEAGL